MESAGIGQVRVRPATPDDFHDIDAVEAAAFGSHADVVIPLMAELRHSGATRLELVAECGDRVIGHVMLSRGWLDAPNRLVEVLILSPIGVAPDSQRLGVGRALITSAVAHAATSVPAIFLEGDPNYYSRVGFAAATGFDSPSVRIPERAFQVRLLPPFEPWMTGRLVYPEAFWIHDAVGLR